MNENNSNQDITICSVYHSLEAKRLLELNYDFVKKRNPDSNIHWVVADNTPPDFSEELDPRKFTIVPGAGEINGLLPWMWGSYRHSRALKNTIPHITTRFALFLDIDFYIVISSWMTVIPRYMQEQGLAFFGVPWHPSHERKWRYFPSPHTLFIDLQKISRDALDFEPVFGDMINPSLYMRVREYMRRNFFPSSVRRRLDIGVYSDTGYPIYKQFAGKTKYECPQPVFRAVPSFFDHLLPDRLSFVPKRAGYFTRTSFGDLGYPDCMARGWEEFMWQGNPYGFHIRGSHKLQNDLERNITYIRHALDEFLRKLS